MAIIPAGRRDASPRRQMTVHVPPMKVLLTGASGFVGSHILDLLLARNIPTAILLRSTSPQRFIEAQLSR